MKESLDKLQSIDDNLNNNHAVFTVHIQTIHLIAFPKHYLDAYQQLRFTHRFKLISS